MNVSVAQVQQLSVPCRLAIGYQSSPRLKKSCPWDGVIKTSAFIGYLRPPGTGVRQWGKRNGNIVEHNGKTYIELADLVRGKDSYIDAAGNELTFEDLVDWLGPSAKKPVIGSPAGVRSFELTKVTHLSLEG